MANNLSNNVTVNRAALIKRMETQLKELEDETKADLGKFNAAVATVQPKTVAALKKALANAEKNRISYVNGKVHVPDLPMQPRHDDYRARRRREDIERITNDLEVIKMHLDETLTVGYRSRWARYL